MANKRQFSLGYLLLEIFWIAAFLGSLRLNTQIPPTREDLLLLAWLLNIVTFSAAVGGAFGRMWSGAIFGLVAAISLFAFLLLFSAMQ